jgi:hypothetical protein
VARRRASELLGWLNKRSGATLRGGMAWLQRLEEAAAAAWDRLAAEPSGDDTEEEPIVRRAGTLEEMLQRYRDAVQPQETVDLAALRQLAFVGIPEELRIRGLYWKLLLGYLPPERSQWAAVLQTRRQEYQAYRTLPCLWRLRLLLHFCVPASLAAVTALRSCIFRSGLVLHAEDGEHSRHAARPPEALG